jgi:hypothetical protein
LAKSWNRIETWLLVGVAGLAVLGTAILGLHLYMTTSATPIHADARAVPATGATPAAPWVAAARVFVEWRGAAAHAPPAGARELQGFDVALLTEVGEVLAGARPGRRSADEVTVYKSTGHAMEDVAAARLVYDRARATGAGLELPR